MKRLFSIGGTAVLAGTMGLAIATPAQAACGQMDLNRNPDSFVYLNWSYSATHTNVEPHGGPGTYMRGVIGRYTASGIRYYFGKNSRNPAAYGGDHSYISETVGTHAGNWYRWGSGGFLPFYNDYSYCKPGV